MYDPGEAPTFGGIVSKSLGRERGVLRSRSRSKLNDVERLRLGEKERLVFGNGRTAPES